MIAQETDRSVHCIIVEAVERHTAYEEQMRKHPLLGRRLENDLRELIISLGETGYVALHRFVVQLDTVRVLSLRHQREAGYLP